MAYFKTAKFFLIISVLAVAVVTVSTLFPFIVGKYTWFRTTVDLALISFLLGLVLSPEAEIYEKKFIKLLKSPLAIAVSIFVLAVILASLFGVDPSFSFWSNFERGEGGLQLLHLLIFFWLLIMLFHDDKDWRKIFWSSIITGLLMTAYGAGAGLKYIDQAANGSFFQSFKDFIGPSFSQPGFRFDGSIGNSSYVGAYAIFILFYLAMLFIGNRSKKKLSFENFALAGLGAIFLAVLYLAATRGAFLGFVVAIVAFLGYFIYVHQAWRKRLLVGVTLFVLVVGLFIKFQDTPFVKSLPASRIFTISLDANTFKTRALMWQIAWDGFKARPIFGWGPENFIQVFDRRFNTAYFTPSQGFGAWFDRAHSIYFDYLVETGAFGFLSFLSIFTIFFIQLYKKTKTNLRENNQLKKNNNHNEKELTNQKYLSSELALLFAVLIAYLVQGIVLFDVLPIYINLFLVLALATYKLKENTYQN
ncbi:MAG: O-antigen ligase family protein [Patescibacteria group bacterium]